MFGTSKYGNIRKFIVVWGAALGVLALISVVGGHFSLAVVDLLFAAGCYGFARYGMDYFPE